MESCGSHIKGYRSLCVRRYELKIAKLIFRPKELIWFCVYRSCASQRSFGKAESRAFYSKLHITKFSGRYIFPCKNKRSLSTRFQGRNFLNRGDGDEKR